MSVQLARRLITVDEYYRMAEVGILTERDRVELIHGEIIKMSPIGSKHAAIVDRLNKILNEYLSGKAIIRIQNPVKVDDLNEPQPDITILKYADDYYVKKHPGPDDIYMVIEVSDTTFAYDKEIKLPLYASAGIPELWIVNIERNEIEVHRSPTTDVYKTIAIHHSEDKIFMKDFDTSFDTELLLGI